MIRFIYLRVESYQFVSNMSCILKWGEEDGLFKSIMGWYHNWYIPLRWSKMMVCCQGYPYIFIPDGSPGLGPDSGVDLLQFPRLLTFWTFLESTTTPPNLRINSFGELSWVLSYRLTPLMLCIKSWSNLESKLGKIFEVDLAIISLRISFPRRLFIFMLFPDSKMHCDSDWTIIERFISWLGGSKVCHLQLYSTLSVQFWIIHG